MKKFTGLLLAFLAIAFIFGCKQGSDGTNSSIVAVYEFSEMGGSGDTLLYRLTFKTDNTCINENYLNDTLQHSTMATYTGNPLKDGELVEIGLDGITYIKAKVIGETLKVYADENNDGIINLDNELQMTLIRK